ncbi:unnamed protein product, partial [Symbiodinium necroappetens]
GGVLLSIDLRQAFDVMPRSRLKEAMALAHVDPAAQHVILQLHAHACFRMTHGNQVASLDTANGVRQGCCLAPSLWVLYTGLILTYIRKQVDMADSTVFADDFLFHWLVDGVDQLEQALKHITFVLETLESFGMATSPGKSAVLIGLRGSKAGAVLSYQSMEALTLKERIRQSWSSFHRILPALRSNSVALQRRVSVWQSCVLSTLMHGLDSVGLAPGGSTLLYKHVVRQLRLVSKAPSHITHEDPAALLTRLRVDDPSETLRLRVQRLLIRLRASYTVPEEVCTPATVHTGACTLGHGGTHEGRPPPGDSGCDPGQGSTGPSTPAAAPKEARAVPVPESEPEPMDAQRDKRAAESANPAGGQWPPGEVAQALRQRKCQDIPRWLAAGSQLSGLQGLAEPPRTLGSQLEERLGQGSRQGQGHPEPLPEHGQVAPAPRGPVWHLSFPGQLRNVRPMPGHAVDGPGALCRGGSMENHEEGDPCPPQPAPPGVAAEALGGLDAHKGHADPGDPASDGHEVSCNQGALPGHEVGGGASTTAGRLKDSRRAPTLERATVLPAE